MNVKVSFFRKLLEIGDFDEFHGFDTRAIHGRYLYSTYMYMYMYIRVSIFFPENFQ